MDRQTMQTEVKKALSETVLLTDGRYGYIISELRDGGVDKWECHVCTKIFNTERAMLMHLSHPLHMNNLRPPHNPHYFRRKISKEEVRKHADVNKKKKDEKPWVATDTIDPGEPIPPGMEDVVKKVCQIQESIDNHPGPLIGIEYLVELVSNESKAEPRYFCLLCEKKGDPRSAMVHLNSTSHSLKYISCFFRTAGNAINMIPKIKENRKGIAAAVLKIAEEIEKTYGRLKPTSAVMETFGQNKFDILRAIDEKEHFRETPTTTYLQYCTEEAIKEFAKASGGNIKNKFTFDESELLSNDRAENFSEKKNQTQKQDNKDMKPLSGRHPDSKLSFSIGKPERSLGRSKLEDKSSEKKDIDDVVLVSTSFPDSGINDPIEIHSMSSISSDSDDLGWSRSTDKWAETRGRSPYRRSPVGRRRFSPGQHRDYRYRSSRSRSHSRSRGRYYRDKDRMYRRDIDKIYNRDRRSHSKDRGDKMRYDNRRRYDRRSMSMERDRRRMSPYRSRSRAGKSPGRSPVYRPRYDKSPEPKKKKVVSEYQAKMDEYRDKLHELEVEMDKKLKFYRERPEKHPQYSEEWKNFWNRRYKELQQSGKDPTGYDFKPEWIIFWDERVKQLHEEEVAIKKEDLKELLPKEEEKFSSDLQDVSPPTPENMRDITVDDIKNTWKALTGSDIKGPPKARSPTPEVRPSTPKRSPSPWESHRERDSNTSRKSSIYNADPPIVHSLRMLSVIEQQLGSLGPKALDLLSKVILMEKVKPNDSMQLLQDPDVHIFFETVKEKIRGQLIAGIVQRYLVNSCRSLINTIENMLATNPLKPKALPKPQLKPTYVPLQPEPLKVEGVGLVNKMAVAQQIAEVLVSQGKTDVSQQELEDLINAVVGIASNSNANVNQSSIAFFSQLNIQKSTANPHINELLSNLITSAQKSIDTSNPSSLLVEQPSVTEESTLPIISPSVSGTITKSSTEIHNSAAPLLQISEKNVSTDKTDTVLQLSPVTINTSKPTIPLLSQVSPNAITLKTPSKAFSEAVSLAKSTISEQALAATKSGSITPIKDKPLFPIKDPTVRETSEEKETKVTNQVSDDELKEKLLIFKTLTREEQQSLIALLKELEGKEPERVEKLRKYVTAGLTQSTPTSSKQEDNRLSPFSSRAGGTNPVAEDRSKTVILDSDNEDDDDYTVEDIYKSVTEKLKKKDTDRKPESRLNQPDLIDESSSSSRYSNPIRPLSPSSHNQGKTSDTKVPPPIVYPPLEKALVPTLQPDRFQSQTTSGMGYSTQGAGWPKSTYSQPPPGTERDVGMAYPQYKDPASQQQDYYSESNQGYQGYPPGPNSQYPLAANNQYVNNQYSSNSQYSPANQYSSYPPPHYPPPQQTPYNNQGGPPPYNYQMRSQDQSYYGNYRQY